MALNFSQVKQIELPSTIYEQVEYLHFNGVDNYLNTGMTFSQYVNHLYEIEFSVDSFGCIVLGNTTFEIEVTSAGVLRAYYGTYPSYLTIASISTNTKYRLVIDHSHGVKMRFYLYQGDTEIADKSSTDMRDANVPSLYAFSKYYPATERVGEFSAGKLYSYKVGTYQYVPYLNKSTGEIGLTTSESATKYDMGGTINASSRGSSVYPGIFSRTIKMIKDSNGNIIWGSQSAFPYRRLEYIHFNGAEYINTNKTVPGNTQYKRIDMYCKYLDLSGWTGSGYYSNSNNKLMLGTTSSAKTQFAVGSQYAYNSSDLISLDTNNYYFWLLWSNNGSTSLALYQNPDETGRIGVTNTYSYSFNTPSGNLYIGAYLDGRNNTIAGYCNMDLKTFAIRTGSYANAIFNGIPCQRKSDGVCGMYDIVTSVFYPMQGTTITSGAAGPVVDEYWNLQA